MTFDDIDQADSFARHKAALRHPDTKSFAVRFTNREANHTSGITPTEVSYLLQARQQTDTRFCLWLNLWGWSDENAAIVNVVAKHYDITSRLAHTICPLTAETPSLQTVDLEKPQLSPTVKLEMSPRSKDLRNAPASIADIASHLWHYCTVDYGQSYICVSWNALFFIQDESSVTEAGKPNAVRIWSSLLICHDGTVLSTFESPSHLPTDIQVAVRSNQINVFSHLSRHGAVNSSMNALMQVKIRDFSGSASQFSHTSELADMLFYYLFDDWISIYYQAIGGDNSYRGKLRTLNKQMECSADVKQVTDLHDIGRELTTLRAVYCSYQSIIRRILRMHRYRPSLSRFAAHSSAQGPDTSDDDDADPLPKANTPSLAFALGPGAVARFERLLDRITLCAMTEVDQCLKEKEDLVTMNFNLVSLKESQTVEKLTRMTILLAKVTILFLPVSLTTAFFSMQFDQINNLYSLRTYWFSFLAVILLTILFLGGFEWLSNRYQGSLVFTGLSRTWLRRRRLGRRRLNDV